MKAPKEIPDRDGNLPGDEIRSAPRLYGCGCRTVDNEDGNVSGTVDRTYCELPALLEAAKLAASAIRNLEGQPIQYSLAKDLSTAVVKLEFRIDRLERRQ